MINILSTDRPTLPETNHPRPPQATKASSATDNLEDNECSSRRGQHRRPGLARATERRRLPGSKASASNRPSIHPSSPCGEHSAPNKARTKHHRLLRHSLSLKNLHRFYPNLSSPRPKHRQRGWFANPCPFPPTPLTRLREHHDETQLVVQHARRQDGAGREGVDHHHRRRGQGRGAHHLEVEQAPLLQGSHPLVLCGVIVVDSFRPVSFRFAETDVSCGANVFVSNRPVSFRFAETDA